MTGVQIMRVGLSATTIEPALTGGRLDGIGVYTSALAAGLPALGCDIQKYAFCPTGKPLLAPRFSESQPMKLPFPALAARDLVLPAAARSRMPVDIYHATDYRIVRMSCPVVATLHDAIPQKYPQWCSPRLRTLKSWMQKKAAKHANHVIALSHFAVAELVEYFDADENRISVVGCGVNDEWFREPSEEEVQVLLERLGLRAGYFLFVGTLQPRKNLDRLLDAYLGLPPEVRRSRQLVIVGRSGWRCEEFVRRLEAVMKDGEPVVWLNNVIGQDALRKLYAGAGIFVFPSLYEGFGIPVAEAFAAGVPVISSDATSLPEVTQGAAVEIDPLSVPSLGTAMLDMAKDDALREKCVAAGRERAKSLTWRRTVEETAAVYHSVLNR